jgi:hypothetical protein
MLTKSPGQPTSRRYRSSDRRLGRIGLRVWQLFRLGTGVEAASKLQPKVRKLFMHEAPFVVEDSHPPMPDDLANQVTVLVSQGRGDDAVKFFFTKGMCIPPVRVTFMRVLLPGWSKMTGMASTLRYGLTILAGTQAVPRPRLRSWSAARVSRSFTMGEGTCRDASQCTVRLARRQRPFRDSSGVQSPC